MPLVDLVSSVVEPAKELAKKLNPWPPNVDKVREVIQERLNSSSITDITSNTAWTVWNNNASTVANGGEGPIAQVYVESCTTDISASNAIMDVTLSMRVWGDWNTSYSLTARSSKTAYPTMSWSVDAPDQSITWTRLNNQYVERHRPVEIKHLDFQYGDPRAERFTGKVDPAEVQRRLANEKRYREEREKADVARRLADEKAMQLLRTCLSPQQREDLEKKRCFYIDVPSPKGKMERYRIDYGTHGNVKQLDEKGSILRSFCVQPDGVPVGDSMLAQKLYLEASEDSRSRFFEIANITEFVSSKAIPHHVPRRERRQHAVLHDLVT